MVQYLQLLAIEVTVAIISRSAGVTRESPRMTCIMNCRPYNMDSGFKLDSSGGVTGCG
jgi:hypothetical protein